MTGARLKAAWSCVSERDRLCLIVPAMGVMVTAIEVMLPPIVWPPLQLTLWAGVPRSEMLPLQPMWFRNFMEAWVGLVWSWHGVALLTVANAAAFAAGFLVLVAFLKRDASP